MEILRPKTWITVIKLAKSEIAKVDIAMAKEPKETLSSFYKRQSEKPDFLINGGLFGMANGVTLSTTVDEGKKIKSDVFSNYGLQINKDNTMIFKTFATDSNMRDFIGGSPTLVIDGKVNIDKKGLEKDSGFINGRHPRTAIGMNKDYFFMVAIDGRRTDKPGMTITELSNFMLNDLKCTHAVNLDGGGSTRMMQKDIVLNSPTENRAVDNFVVVYLKKVVQPSKPQLKKYTITASVLNIRSTPNGQIVGTYKKGETVEALEVKDGWIKTAKGWISAQYAKILS